MNTAEIVIGKEKKLISFPNKENCVKFTQIIYGEVFDEQHYREGLRHIKDIEKPVIVDLGANIGISILYFNQKKNCIFYGVEPDKEYFEALNINTKGLNIQNYNIGIGAINSKRKLEGMSYFYNKETDKTQETVCITLETFFKIAKLDHVDLLKMDVEGTEYEIFSTPAFKNVAGKIDFIILEAHLRPFPCHPEDIPHLLMPLGFEVKRLPVKNFIAGWKLGFSDGQGKQIEGKLSYKTNTMFVARKT